MGLDLVAEGVCQGKVGIRRDERGQRAEFQEGRHAPAGAETPLAPARVAEEEVMEQRGLAAARRAEEDQRVAGAQLA